MSHSIAKRYYEICEQIKALEKLKTELRAELMGVIGSSQALMLDGIMITQEPRERASIDREKLTTKMGAKFVQQYLKTTYYSEIRCKLLAA